MTNSHADQPTTVSAGYVECSCCQIIIIGVPGDPCDSCRESCADEPTATADNWHCFTGYCDGSGCTYAGECEPTATVPGA